MVTLINFWNNRNVVNSNLPDHYSTNNVSVVIAWLAYKLRITPNQLSVMSGVIASAAFGLALFLPAADLTSSLLWLFGFAQMAYIFDCVDGQLARTTKQESEFGALSFIAHIGKETHRSPRGVIIKYAKGISIEIGKSASGHLPR